MDEKELARSVATEEGGDLVAETEKALDTEKTRSLGIVEVMSMGSFLAASAQLAFTVWQGRKDRALLIEALLDKAPESPLLDPERRLGILGRIADKLVPDSWGASPSLGAMTETDKRAWIKAWQASLAKPEDGATRGFSRPTQLQAFGDMDYYCLCSDYPWTPPDALASKLPAVTVPKGFVTDLASVPQLFWSLLPPQGRYGHAAILHDWLYWDQGSSRKVADEVFRVAMEDLNVTPVARTAIYGSVRVFAGPIWEGEAKKKAKGARRVLARVPDDPAVTWDDWRQRPDVFV